MKFWPKSYQGAISLSFDDGMRSHLEFAVPQLNARDIKATFYLNPGKNLADSPTDHHWRQSLDPWLLVQANGHEIGNHTISHPCSLNVQLEWQSGNNILDWSLEQIETDIREAQRRIEIAFPSQSETSFAYPCYESTLGRGRNRISYTPIVSKYFIAARAKGELRGDLANDPLYCDLHHLSSWAVERQPGALMIGLVEQATALGRWGIFTFHGIQEGHLPVGDTDFVELLDHLDRRSDTIWVAPIAPIAAYILNSQQI